MRSSSSAGERAAFRAKSSGVFGTPSCATPPMACSPTRTGRSGTRLRATGWRRAGKATRSFWHGMPRKRANERGPCCSTRARPSNPSGNMTSRRRGRGHSRPWRAAPRGRRSGCSRACSPQRSTAWVSGSPRPNSACSRSRVCRAEAAGGAPPSRSSCRCCPTRTARTRRRQLSDELLEIVPAPEARAAYIRAVHTQLLGYAVSADHERGWRSLAFIDTLGTDLSEPDVATRGYARLWRSVLHAILSDELELAQGLCEQAIVALSESQVMYRLSLALIVRSFILWQFGELERSEQAARAARAIAEQIHDDYHAALAAWYLVTRVRRSGRAGEAGRRRALRPGHGARRRQSHVPRHLRLCAGARRDRPVRLGPSRERGSEGARGAREHAALPADVVGLSGASARPTGPLR